MLESLSLWLNDNKQLIIDLRRWLHQHPELGFQEFETSEYLKKMLTKKGYHIVQNQSMKTGFYCDYVGSKEGPILALRTDMDALAIDERSKEEYISINKGVMHACGHDVHMSIIASLAIYFIEKKVDIKGTVRFLFQPAEEKAPGGALSMIEGEAIKDVSHIFGSHVYPKMEAGQIALKYGPIAATVELIEITLNGMGGHTSRPNESVDLIWAQSQLVQMLEQTLNHSIDQQEPVVLAFGKIEGGSAHNVLPDSVKLYGTLRYLNPGLQDILHQKISDSIENVSSLSSAKISWKSDYACPGVVNNKELVDIIMDSSKKAIGEENTKILDISSMGGEDFAYYLQQIPGAYFRIGSYDGKSRDIHTSDFDVNEECIFTAIKVYCSIVENYFKS